MKIRLMYKTSALAACVAFALPVCADPVAQARAIRADVLFLRHALAPGTGDPAGFQLDDCTTQRNLSAE